MASRYWVGNGGNWTDTAHWSTISGGSSGSNAPTSSDDVFFDSNSFPSGGTCTLVGASVANSITFSFGSLDTNNQSLTISNSFISDGILARTLTLGSSSISCPTWQILNTTNFSLFSGTSTITNNTTFVGGSLAYYNYINNPSVGTSNVTFSGSNSFNNLTLHVAPLGSASFTYLQAGTTQTIAGTFRLSDSASSGAKSLIRSTVTGTPATINAAAINIIDIDFMDITGAGAATWSGTRFGDAGGNSNITFNSPVTRYWISGTGNWTDTAHWSTSSGGSSGATAPLCHDNAIFDANSFSSNGQVVSASGTSSNPVDIICFPSMNWSGITKTCILLYQYTQIIYWVGSQTFSNKLSQASDFGFKNIHITSRNDQTIDLVGTIFGTATLSGVINIYIDTLPGKTVTLLSDLNINAFNSLTTFQVFGVLSGGFNANNFNIGPFYSFNSNSTATRSITMGSGTWNIQGTNDVWDTTTTTNLTFNAGTSLIKVTNQSSGSKAFNGGGLTFNDLQFTGDTAGPLTIVGANTFDDFIVDNGNGIATKSVIFPSSIVNTIATLTANGSSGHLIVFTVSTPGTQTTLVIGTANVSYVNVQDNVALGAAIPVLDNPGGVDSGNNINWFFSNSSIPFLQNTFFAGADSAGDIQTINVGKSDDSSPIYYELETQELEFGNRQMIKAISEKLGIACQYADDSKIEIIEDKKDPRAIKIGMGKRINIITLPNLKGHYITLRWSGNSTTKSPILEGFYLNKIIDEGF